MKTAHNLSIVSSYNEQLEQWMHNLTVVISDVEEDTGRIEQSEQIAVTVAPAMQPTIMVQAMRAFADGIEQYLQRSEEEQA